jgi:hypothetical protein
LVVRAELVDSCERKARLRSVVRAGDPQITKEDPDITAGVQLVEYRVHFGVLRVEEEVAEFRVRGCRVRKQGKDRRDGEIVGVGQFETFFPGVDILGRVAKSERKREKSCKPHSAKRLGSTNDQEQ